MNEIRRLILFHFVIFWALLSQIHAKEAELWVIVYNSDVNSDYLFSDRMTRLANAQTLKKLLESNGDRVELMGVSSLKFLGQSVQKLLKPNEVLRGLGLMGHGNEASFAHHGSEFFSADDLGDLLKGELSNVPLSQRFSLYLNSCRGACVGESGESFQRDFLEEVWPWLRAVKSVQSLEVIAHEHVSRGGFTSNNPLVRALVRTSIPGRITDAISKISGSSYRELLITYLPLLIGLGAPLLTKWGLPNALALAAYVGGISSTGIMILAQRMAATAVKVQTINDTGRTVLDRQTLAIALRNSISPVGLQLGASRCIGAVLKLGKISKDGPDPHLE